MIEQFYWTDGWDLDRYYHSRSEMNLGVIAMSTPHFQKLQDWSLTIRCFSHTRKAGSYPYAGMRSVCSTAPTDWALCFCYFYFITFLRLLIFNFFICGTWYPYDQQKYPLLKMRYFLLTKTHTSRAVTFTLERYDTPYPPTAMGLVLFFYMGSLGIKLPTKVNISLNKAKLSQTKY